MRDQDKTRDQLAAELAEERRRVSELEAVLGRTKLAQEKLLKTHDELHEELAEETTARIRFQEALASSERFHRTLVETSKDIIWTVGLDLKYTYVSPSVYEVLGFTVDEIMSTDPLDGLTPSSRERILQMFREELDFETKLPMDRFRSRTVEIERYRKDGAVAWEEVTATLLRNSAGRPIGILGISRDIADRKRAEESLQRSHKELEQRVKDRTADLLKANEELKREIKERLRAEEALRQSEERFRIVFEAAQDCIYIKDRDLRYTHVNPAMLDLLDLRLTGITGKTDSDLLGTELGARFASLEARVLAGQTIETEQSLTIGGADLAFSVVRFPVRDASGTIIGLCGIARDVTERKSWESELSIEADQFSSPAMKEILRQVRLVAKSDSIILLLGESGSGKDFLARYVHEHSNRSGGPFFAINCAALAPELVEAELFGHEAGAFTGSRGRKRGLLELAEGGTLLLNEIGELPARLQAKLLTFLDTQSFIRVGGEKSVSVNTRIIAATNRDLQKEMESGNFRADLFYRLNVLAITVPPLRHRIQDLPVLVREIVAGLATRLGLHGTPFIEPEAMDALSGYSWPGNIRELRNVLERSLILGGHARIEAGDLKILSESAAGPVGPHLAFAVEVGPGVSMPDAIQQAKRMLVQEGLRRSGGSLKHAAYLLGISRDSLKHHLKSLGSRGRKSPPP